MVSLAVLAPYRLRPFTDVCCGAVHIPFLVFFIHQISASHTQSWSVPPWFPSAFLHSARSPSRGLRSLHHRRSPLWCILLLLFLLLLHLLLLFLLLLLLLFLLLSLSQSSHAYHLQMLLCHKGNAWRTLDDVLGPSACWLAVWHTLLSLARHTFSSPSGSWPLVAK